MNTLCFDPKSGSVCWLEIRLAFRLKEKHFQFWFPRSEVVASLEKRMLGGAVLGHYFSLSLSHYLYIYIYNISILNFSINEVCNMSKSASLSEDFQF